MNDQSSFSIFGRPLPLVTDSETVFLAKITISLTELGVAMVSTVGTVELRSKLWEHSIHELELLSSCLRTAAEHGLPPPLQIPREESQISASVHLPLAVEMELGYSIEEPGKGRARLFCYSITYGRKTKHFGVGLAIGVNGAFGEVVLEPTHALKMSEWIDRQLEWLSSEA